MARKRERPSRGDAPRQRWTAEQRKEQILREAARIFAERGFAGAKIRAIAAACGVTEAVIYQHFPSKEALFRAALEKRLAEHDVEAFLQGLPPDLPMLEVFQKVARRLLDIGLKDPIGHKLLLAASVAGTPETSSVYVSCRLPFVRYLEQVIRAGIEAGRLRPVNPLLTARAFVGLVMDCVLSCDLWPEVGETVYAPGELVNNTVPTFVLGLQKRPDTTQGSGWE